MKMSNDRGGFEKSWEKAFENAEMHPSNAVWANIEEKLDASEDKKKRGFLILKLAIAASVVFALSVVFYNTLSDREGKGQLAFETSKPEGKHSNDNVGTEDLQIRSSQKEANNDPRSVEGNTLSRQERNKTNYRENQEPDNSSASSTFGKKDDGSGKMHDVYTTKSDKIEDMRTFLSASGNVARDLKEESLKESTHSQVQEQSEVLAFADAKDLGALSSAPGDIVEIQVYPLGYDLISQDKKDRRERSDLFIAGLNFSAGVFDPGVTASSAEPEVASPALSNDYSSFSKTVNEYAYSVNSVNNSFSLTENESYKQSVAYSYGANFGYQITKRIVLLTGVNYTKAYSKFSSGLGITENGNNVTNAIVTNRSGDFEDVAELENTELKIDNSFQFASVPVKAGYVILDKKVNLTILTGVSTEFLLSSSHDSGNTELNSFTLAAYEEKSNKDYNPIYFNGLLGLNLGYTLLDHYRFSLEPSLRKSLSSFSDSNNEVSKPLYKMISVGISYQF